MSQFSVTKLSIAIAASLAASTSFAAGMDLSGQDIKGFFNPGTYAEIDYVYVNTDISMHDNAATIAPGGPEIAMSPDTASYVRGTSTGNMTGDNTTFMRYGVKTDVSDNISLGVFYDRPFGANVRITNPDSNFVSNANQQVRLADGVALPISTVDPRVGSSNYDPHTNVRVKTDSLSAIIGYKTNGIQVYGGPVMQRAEAQVHLRGNAYGPSSGYDAIVNNDTAYGWLAGVSYSIPEIALNAALTYRSAIKHETNIAEYLPVFEAPAGAAVRGAIAGNLPGADVSQITAYSNQKGSVTTPESVNLNFQTGLSAEHQLLGTLDVRWVPWSKFSIVPPAYNVLTKAANPNGLPLLDYDKDQWKVDVGLGKRFTEQLAGSVQVGWDSGAGNPVSSLGPVDGAWSLGGGVKYNVTPEWAVSLGGKYMWFGDAHAKLPTNFIVGHAEKNNGYVVGAKVSYHGQ